MALVCVLTSLSSNCAAHGARPSPKAKATNSVATGWILSKFYVEKAFSEEAKGFGDRIVSDIKVQFIKKLRGAEWMSKSVRNLGIEKGECPLLI